MSLNEEQFDITHRYSVYCRGKKFDRFLVDQNLSLLCF